MTERDWLHGIDRAQGQKVQVVKGYRGPKTLPRGKGWKRRRIPCPECAGAGHGSGRIIAIACRHCRGTGRITEARWTGRK